MSNSSPTDAELVQLINRTSCPVATATLVERHTPRVWAVVFPLLVNHADADEVTQATLLNALQGLSSFRHQAAFSTWLYRIAINTARNHNRKNRRYRVLHQSSSAATDYPSADYNSPPDSCTYVELTDQISRAMLELPFAQRTALVLVAIEGYDCDTAAQIARCNPSTLRWRLHRARQRLRTILSNQGVL